MLLRKPASTSIRLAKLPNPSGVFPLYPESDFSAPGKFLTAQSDGQPIQSVILQGSMIDFSRFRFSSVIDLPAQYEVFDFTRGYDPARDLKGEFGIGRYNEDRRGMYETALFNGSEPRTIHVGIDIGAPVGTPVKAFYEGEIFLVGYNGAEGDYGNTVITRHLLDGEALFALHGHLSAPSIRERSAGTPIRAGEIIAWVGDRHENGGWNPHLHFQLSLEQPEACDMPGVVAPAKREWALQVFPDPRLVLGPLY